MRAISEFVGLAAEAAGLNEGAVYAVQMAVDEACTNIIEHAYGGEGRGDIEITWRISADRLTVILQDCGRPFDPTGVSPPDIRASLEDSNARGLGLYLMRRLMDKVNFEFTRGSGNVLTMVKLKEAAP